VLCMYVFCVCVCVCTTLAARQHYHTACSITQLLVALHVLLQHSSSTPTHRLGPSSELVSSGDEHFYNHGACVNNAYVGLAMTIHAWCTNGILGLEITKYTVINGVFILGWPDPYIR